MFGVFGLHTFGSTWHIPAIPILRYVSVVGDLSDHGGYIINSNQDGTLFVDGKEVVVAGALHSCPKDGHGITSITPVVTKTYQNGKLIITSDAICGCGAKIISPDRKVYIE